MSWDKIVKDLRIIGHVAYDLLPIATSVMSVVDPPVGILLTGIMGKIQTSVLNAEQKYPAQGTGVQKASFVVAQFEEGLEIAREALANSGQDLSYDGNALQDVISAQTTLLNAHATLSASFKVLPKT